MIFLLNFLIIFDIPLAKIWIISTSWNWKFIKQNFSNNDSNSIKILWVSHLTGRDDILKGILWLSTKLIYLHIDFIAFTIIIWLILNVLEERKFLTRFWSDFVLLIQINSKYNEFCEVKFTISSISGIISYFLLTSYSTKPQNPVTSEKGWSFYNN